VPRFPLPPLPPEDFVCVECGFGYAVSVDDAVVTLRNAVLRLTALVEATRADVRARPAPETWSAVEYVCHVRDVLMTSAIRLHRVVRERGPVLEPMFNDWRADRFRYRDEDVPAVLAQVRRAGDGLLDEVASVRPDAWERTGGRFPDEQRSASWFVRHAAHETAHHLRDIRAGLGG